jgi:hypothetical protein
LTTPDFLPSKEELKAKLPLAYVAAQLGITLDHDLKALCPFHEDRNPSFHLWRGDDGIERWHCYPCNLGGDLFDLIQRARGADFSTALTIATRFLTDLPEGYEPPALSFTAPADPEQMNVEVSETRERAERPDYRGILSVRTHLADADDIRAAQAYDDYLRAGWGWGINERGAVYMPHWDKDGNLTGCKIRGGDGSRMSIKGSSYHALYGAWRKPLLPNVAAFITEGETDAVWTAYTAQNKRIPIDVYALPSGASQPFETEWIDFLRGYRTIYLAFDPDQAGVEATRVWISALLDVGGFGDGVRVCCLPLGRDLRDAKPNLQRLLAAARRPLPEPDDISSAPGGYTRPDRNGNIRRVTSWTIEPIAQLAGGDEQAGFDVRLSHAGIDREVVIRLSDFASVQTLNRWANHHSLIFTGTNADLQVMANLVKARGHITPEVFQTTKVGLHFPPEEYLDLGPSTVYTTSYEGKLPWRYAPTRMTEDLQGRTLLPAEGNFSWNWLECFLALSSTDVTHPLLAWVVAASRRPEVPEFPLLFIGGSSGVGKSTLARLALRLGGSKIELDLAAVTQFILLRTLASSTSLPVFVDEWTRLSRRDTREAFQGYIPALYAQGLGQRGQADLGAVSYRLTAPTIVAGEDTFSLDREKDRTVAVYPTRANQNSAAHDIIARAPLERFAALLHYWLATEPEGLPPLTNPAESRPAHNRDVLEAGWEMLRMLLVYASQRGEVVPDIPIHPDLSCFDVDMSEDEENVYESALQEGLGMRDQHGLPTVWADPEGRGTWVRAKVLINLIERNTDIDLPGRSRAMLGYFKERYDVQDGRPVPPFGSANATLPARLIVGLHIQDTPLPDPEMPA